MRNNYKRIFVTWNNLHGFIRARIFHGKQSLNSDRIPTESMVAIADSRSEFHVKNKQINKIRNKRGNKNNKELTKQKRNTR